MPGGFSCTRGCALPMLFLSSYAAAQAQPAPAPEYPTEEPTVHDPFGEPFWDPPVVTPTGQPTRVSEAPSTTFVITGDEIRQSGAVAIWEVLRRVPGLDVRHLAESDGQIGPRGFAFELSDRHLVLIDGRPAVIDFFGGTNLELLPVALVDIDRIEVVVGPGASVYGNKALLGTINIITRKPSDYPVLEARSTTSTLGDVRTALRQGVIVGPWRGRASAYVKRSRFAAKDASHDALRAVNGVLGLRYSPRPNLHVDVEGGATQGLTYIIPTGSQLMPFKTTFAYAKLDAHVGLGGASAPLGEVTVVGAWSHGRLSSPVFPGGEGGFRARYDTPYLEASHNLRYSAWDLPMQLRWGGELRLNDLESTVTTDESALLNLALFASNALQLASVHITVGLRMDRQRFLDDPSFDFNLSPRLSVLWLPAVGHQVRAAMNMGYNNPDLAVLFSDFDVSADLHVMGSRDLKVERILYGELGYSGVLTERVRFFAHLFAYRLLHYVALRAGEPTPDGSVGFENCPAVQAHGGELGTEIAPVQELSLYASYALLRVTTESSFPYRGDNLGSPKHKASAGARLSFSQGPYATLDLHWVSASHVDRVPRDPKSESPFVTTDLRAFFASLGRLGYSFSNGVDVSVATTNALGDRTRQFPGGERPRRRFYVSLAYFP